MDMQAANVEPGVRSILDAYTRLGALQLGKEIHGYFIRNLYKSMKEQESWSLGNISSARVCFNYTLVKDLVT